MPRPFTTASATLLGLVLGLTPFGAQPALAAIETQTFASDPAPAGWVGQNNNDVGSGGVYGWSPGTNNTQGDPAGEAGGLFARANGVASYYLDQTIAGPYTVGSALHAEGELFLQPGSPAADTEIVVGFVNPALGNPAHLDDYVGFRISPAGGNTIRANAFGGDWGGYNPDGTNAGQPNQATFADGAYTFSFDYVPDPLGNGTPSPNPGQITLTITPASGGGSPTVLRSALATGQNRSTRELTAFGLTHFNSSSGSTLTNTYFIDNLSYTGDPIPEPAGAALLAVVGLAALARRRRV